MLQRVDIPDPDGFKYYSDVFSMITVMRWRFVILPSQGMR